MAKLRAGVGALGKLFHLCQLNLKHESLGSYLMGEIQSMSHMQGQKGWMQLAWQLLEHVGLGKSISVSRGPKAPSALELERSHLGRGIG